VFLLGISNLGAEYPYALPRFTMRLLRWAEVLPEFLLPLEYLLILLLAPALTAGAITEEKTAGSLQLLLAAGLTSWDILMGKLLGRLLPLLFVLLTCLPMLCLGAALADQPAAALAAMILAPFLILYAVGAVGLLVSVWSRTTNQAFLGVYLLGSALTLAIWWFGSPLRWLDPFSLPPLSGGLSGQEMLGRLLGFVAGWGSILALCLTLGAWLLRPAYLAQTSAGGRRGGRGAPRRPAVGNDPLCWKERYLDGLAPSVTLRWVPRWFGLGLVTVVSALFLWVLCLPLPVPASGPSPSAGKYTMQVLLFLHGLLTALSFGWLVGVRAAGAVTTEVQQGTWEPLLLTDLEAREVVRGKHRGILRAFYPYLAAALVPPVAFSLLIEPAALCWSLFWCVVIVSVARVVGAVGIHFSARSQSTWASLSYTLLVGTPIGCLFVAMPLAVNFTLGLWSLHGLGASGKPLPDEPERMAAILPPALFLSSVTTAVLLHVMTNTFLTDAEREVRLGYEPQRRASLLGPRT
jgi:hypothetical protein